ncbi:EF-hand calcium-binding domain-containing protein 4B-like isoform X2 [Haliotis rufescens]|nr:EF-hand calcium-binding domain-containing protein 4B-like isoform X2 [Haliotis rufescens]XP_046333186.2 EF-hand calcium-binding domain-containing protein 4B-like isoform X2 [Haliotis rufescens]XP_046333187.2 EF-hand calcium-binding domain-containing protein 4B-like isoform X2 [Haliotis rufescens]XP_046333188.2 EF-hand calcium-binding domain-containing protein 4B-like isoform X2 [Haliotis rufescens]XP_046333189.2 EF-hand calcium-binding domain-containing protein 4B-like isoform X2 [Haliotis r
MTEPDQDEIHEIMVQKATELFKVCDKEENGVISKRDMQRLRSELPLSPDMLEDVFDSLDLDGNGFLTLQEFIDGFERIRTNTDRVSSKCESSNPSERNTHRFRRKKLQSLHCSFLGMKPGGTGSMEEEEGEERVYEDEDDGANTVEVEKHFQEMMNNVGAKRFFNDDDTIKALWVKLRADEPELLGDFEEFLNRVTSNIKQSQNDFESLETALRSKTNAHDEEVRKLYEEMETQIKQERDRILKEEKAKEKQLREEMEREIFEKDRQLQELLQKHQEMESQLEVLNMTETETKQENEKLMNDKERLEELLMTSQDNLEESKTYINQLREQDKHHTKERARLSGFELREQRGGNPLIRKGRRLQGNDEPISDSRRAAMKMTEGIAMERESLVKQLDMLRDMNRKLRDDKDEAEAAESRRDPSPNALDRELSEQALSTTETLPDRSDPIDLTDRSEVGPVRKKLTKQGSVLSNYFPGSTDRRSNPRTSETLSEDVDGHLADIDDDIECDEDDNYNSHSLLSTNLNSVNGSMNEEMYTSQGHDNSMYVESGYSVRQPNGRDVNSSDTESEAAARGHNSRLKNGHSHNAFVDGLRGQPVGATATVESGDRGLQPAEPTGPERIFKVVFVGDSGVGKSSFIYRFCHRNFKQSFSATIGVDFQIKTMMSEGKLIALQLWDTAGQERFRSITKQYFRKADGVIVMYDVTSENSFVNIRNWMNSVKEGVDDDTVIVIVGNKMDLAENDNKRVIKTKDGIKFADEYGALFYETSAKIGSGVTETMEALACVLREKEDKSIEAALRLEAGTIKKKGCCS